MVHKITSSDFFINLVNGEHIYNYKILGIGLSISQFVFRSIVGLVGWSFGQSVGGSVGRVCGSVGWWVGGFVGRLVDQ